VSMLDTKFEKHGGDGHWRLILTLRARSPGPDGGRTGMRKGQCGMCSELSLIRGIAAIFRLYFHIPPEG
jgi:hypothetical protein